MKVKIMEVGPVITNCYIVENEKTGHAVVVDPGDEGTRIVSALKRGNLTVDAILLTHGHLDHISGLKEVREATGAKVYMAAEDAERLTHAVSAFSPGRQKILARRMCWWKKDR